MSNWIHMSYGSGTQVVTSDDPKRPHYYVYADERSEVCEELMDFMNGGVRPAWLNKLTRESPTSCTGPDGIKIYTTGPMVLPAKDNGSLNWKSESDKELERIMLIDFLMKD